MFTSDSSLYGLQSRNEKYWGQDLCRTEGGRGLGISSLHPQSWVRGSSGCGQCRRCCTQPPGARRGTWTATPGDNEKYYFYNKFSIFAESWLLCATKCLVHQMRIRTILIRNQDLKKFVKDPDQGNKKIQYRYQENIKFDLKNAHLPRTVCLYYLNITFQIYNHLKWIIIISVLICFCRIRPNF